MPAAVDPGGESAITVASGGDHACALTTAGGVKCWGSNREGQLGDGTQLDRSAAVNVAGLTSSVKAITAGETCSCAVRSDGALLCWGTDPARQQCLIPEPVPLLVGPVQSVYLGQYHACVLVQANSAADPIVQCWGHNRSGELGVNNGWLPVDVVMPAAWGYLPYAARK